MGPYGMVTVHANPDCPGATQALAIRVVGAVNAAALSERKPAADTGDAAGAARAGAYTRPLFGST